MTIHYLLMDVNNKGNWVAGQPYPDKLNAFTSAASYGNAVTPYAFFLTVDIPDVNQGVTDYNLIPEVAATAVAPTPAVKVV
jgi:hypothetical protein